MKLILLSLAAVLLVLLMFFIYFIVSTRGPLKGVRDYDPRLTTIAKGAEPIIDAVLNFYQQHHEYPSEVELRQLVDDPRRGLYNSNQLGNSVWPRKTMKESDSWGYSYTTGMNPEFSLGDEFRFGEGLTFSYDGHKGHWTYYRESDDTEITILLKL